MFNATEVLIDAFVNRVREGYHRTYGSLKTDYQDIIAWVGSMALENIANSDALYHNVEHSISVTLVGQEVLRGKHIREGGVSSEDWLHFIISLLCHDIGYVKGVCRQDREEESLYATGKDEAMISLPLGASDASLTPHHVDRAKLFIDERFGGHKLIDSEVIKSNIELTRFPVPAAEDHQETNNYAGLVRAADLIGQLSDPRYLKKITSLFYEFEETGMNKILGYNNPADLRNNYPKFYWNGVYPYIKDGLRYLSLTQQGKQIIANLYSNVFVVEHESPQEKHICLENLEMKEVGMKELPDRRRERVKARSRVGG
ncbi:MAG: Npun_R2479 family HD domain-containing metalloprotein [Cyanobacteria bacterium P01_C01_bin.38]